ncbi:MAG: hypothetical protein WCR42_09485 [bacterium]
MKKLKTNLLFWVMILPLIVIPGCHSIDDNGYDPKRSLPGWGVYQEHPNFPINGYYYNDATHIPHEFKSNLETNDSIPIYNINIYYINGIYKDFLCKAESLNQLDYNIENNINIGEKIFDNTHDFGSYQISNDSLFLYSIDVYIPKNGKPPKSIFQILNNKELHPVGYYFGMDNVPIQLFTDSVFLRFRPLKHKPDSTNELMQDTFLQGQMRKGYEEYINRKK